MRNQVMRVAVQPQPMDPQLSITGAWPLVEG